MYSLRIPSVQHDQFYKFRRGDADNINFLGGQRNGSQTYRQTYPTQATRVMHNKRTEIKKINSVPMSTTPANLFLDQITDSFADISTNHTATVIDAVTEVTRGH